MLDFVLSLLKCSLRIVSGLGGRFDLCSHRNSQDFGKINNWMAEYLLLAKFFDRLEKLLGFVCSFAVGAANFIVEIQ